MGDKCERCNGEGTLQKCHRCGVVYRHIHKYSDCDSPGCDGERSDPVPCPDCGPGAENPAYTAAVAALRDRCPSPGSRWRHRKGGLYTVTGGCVVEATLAAAVLYRGADGVVWCRGLDEFLDGRFTREDT